MVTGVRNLQGNLFVITNHNPGNIPHNLLLLLIRNATVLNPVTKVTKNFQMPHWHGIEMEVTSQKCHLVLRTGGNNTTVTPLELVWADHTGVGAHTGVPGGFSRESGLHGRNNAAQNRRDFAAGDHCPYLHQGDREYEDRRCTDKGWANGWKSRDKMDDRREYLQSMADLMISAVILLRRGRSQDDWRKPSSDSDVVKQTGEYLKAERCNSAGPCKEQSHCLPLASSSLGRSFSMSSSLLRIFLFKLLAQISSASSLLAADFLFLKLLATDFLLFQWCNIRGVNGAKEEF
ncbi:hypothetical protein RHSIM_Rhsim10G0146200 [Rhododendron simsii]|uniref:Uncharacterized protein n=1 Tax=Rhododendron simsii TaxID=118357 RepID=A0A834LCC3_RHOSS|nr:hypothetical protein RHSIM_Rhsim10G0146200 [Rhododendron simsii]